MLWHSKIFFPFISYHFYSEKFKPPLLCTSGQIQYSHFFFLLHFFSLEKTSSHSISFRTRCLSVLLCKILLKVYVVWLELNSRDLVNLKSINFFIREPATSHVWEKQWNKNIFKHEKQTSAWKSCRLGVHSSNQTVLKTYQIHIYHFQDRRAATAIRYETPSTHNHKNIYSPWII